MNRAKYLSVLVAVFSLLLWTGHSFAQYNGWNGGTVQHYYQSGGWDGIEASQLIGQRVYSPVGGDLGQISDLLVDRLDGHIVLVILSDVPGFGSEFLAAPFGALERIGESLFQLNLGDREIPIASAYRDPYVYELIRHRDTVGFSIVPSAIDSVWADSVHRFYGQKPYWAAESHRVIMSYRTAEPSLGESLFMGKTSWALMGAKVRSGDGIAVVRIDDLVIDSRDGRVALLVLDRVPARDGIQVAVPFDELSMNGKPFALYAAGEKLAVAPGFNEMMDMHNLKGVENIYRFFGQQPYWVEGEAQKETR